MIVQIPKNKLYPDKIVSYSELSGWSQKQENQNSLNNLKSNQKYKGILSVFAQKTIHKRLTTWLTALSFYNEYCPRRKGLQLHKPIFVTLTLSETQKHSDQYIKKHLLDSFLKRITYNNYTINYFWKAEKQKNGNIHFHLILDKYLPAVLIQKIWNSIQEKNGYIENYYKKTGKKQPPSTHVKSIENYEIAVKYVMKYCSKNESAILVTGRLFSFSKKLLNLDTFTLTNGSTINSDLDAWMEKQKYKTKTFDYCSVNYTNDFNYMHSLPSYVKNQLIAYYLNIYSELYSDYQNTDLLNAYLNQINKKNETKQKPINQIKPTENKIKSNQK